MNRSKYKFFAATASKKNDINETLHREDPHSGLFLVTDGMGGKGRGDLASRLASEFISKTVDQSSLETESTWLFDSPLPPQHRSAP